MITIIKNIKIPSILFVILFSSLVSCGQNKNQDKVILEELQGKKILLPTKDAKRSLNGNLISPLTKRTKILTLIDGDCGTCIDVLTAWKSFIKKVDTTQVGFIFIVYSHNNFTTFDNLNKSIINFNYPFFQDKNKQLFKINDFYENKKYQTFLLNESNNIILVGNPIHHQVIENLYIKEIKKMTNEAILRKKASLNQYNRTSVKSGFNYIFKDEQGNVIEKKKIKELMSTSKYKQTINHETKVITIQKKD